MSDSQDLTQIDANFGSRLKSAREKREMSQVHLAESMRPYGFDFTQQTIYKIEAGHRKVTVGEATALAKALGLWSVADLSRGEGSLQVSLMIGLVDIGYREFYDAGQRVIRHQVQLARDISGLPDDTELPDSQLSLLRDTLYRSFFETAHDLQGLALTRITEDSEVSAEIKALLTSRWGQEISSWSSFEGSRWLTEDEESSDG